MKRLMAIGAAAALASGAAAQDAVQWRVEDGGNGHWYQVKDVGHPSWMEARTIANSLGGHLATLTSLAESDFAAAIFPTHRATVVGGYQDRNAVDYAEPAGGWRWVTGEPWAFTNWIPGNPLNTNSGHGEPGSDYLYMSNTQVYGSQWGDGDSRCPECEPPVYIVEWSADCNSDGLVDFGQIRAGELVDANANNIPDCCEAGVDCDPCLADISGNGTVDGVDLAAVLNSWGNAPTGKSNADVNGDGVVDGADLAEVLNAWGACP
jgi:hypothetical protein